MSKAERFHLATLIICCSLFSTSNTDRMWVDLIVPLVPCLAVGFIFVFFTGGKK